MKLYLLQRTDVPNYEDYDSAIVAAKSPEDAANIHPDEEITGGAETWRKGFYATWPDIESVKVTEIGKAIGGIGRGVILASLNVG